MKKVFFGLAIAAATLFSSCGMMGLSGMLYTDVTVKDEVIDNATLGKKVGRSSATSYLGLIAIGDAGVNTAAENGGIKKVSHVDMKVNSILGIISTYELVVYGE